LSKIKILPENLANQIAAGEVVERPASVVKELVENAIDAGAGKVAVQVEGGGTSLIRIIDDGQGMDQDDILLSLERHATSKLLSLEQLDDIRTLGFRGEAVPSISSVSRMSITSRPAGYQLGSRVEVRFGKVSKVHEMGCQAGTVVEVRDLFGNVPARKKFLKTPRTELSHIEETVRNYALVRPELTMSYKVNGREVFSLPAVVSGTMDLRLQRLLGLHQNEKLLAIKNLPGNDKVAAISGFILPPDSGVGPVARLRSFVNGRPVRDRLLSHAVAEGMRNFLMKGRHPAGVVFIEVSPSEVDVNVHPTKQEVRFRRPGEIHQLISMAVAETLTEYQDTLKRAVFGAGKPASGREEVHEGAPIPGCGHVVQPQGFPQETRHGLEERFVRLVVLQHHALDRHCRHDETALAPCVNLLLHLPHEPRLAGLARRPDGEVVPAHAGGPDKLVGAGADEFLARHAEVHVGVNRAIGMEPSHHAGPS